MRKRQWVILSLLIILYAVATVLVHQIYLSRMDEYEQNRFEQLEFQTASVLESHEKFSEYLFQTIVEDEFVLKSVHDAWYVSEEERTTIRNDLAEYLQEDYDLITQYDFRQLHFHFRDSSSFLRMHAQDKFGDSLVAVRYSVWLTNETFRPSTGFEEGKIFNGYRFVYPLEYNGEHIGSVEISVSGLSVINELTELYDHYDYGMVLSKEVVDEKLFEDQLQHYQTSSLSDQFYDDIEVVEESPRNNLETYQINHLLSHLDFEHDEFLNYFEVVEYEGEEYELIIVPLTNIQQQDVGYFYSVSTEKGFLDIHEELRINMAMLSVVTLGLGILIYMIDSRRELMKIISETDQVTGVYNRRKFEEVYHVEYERAKRYESTFSLIMLDLDHFKQVNDQFGHQVGDDVLLELSNVIKEQLRITDSFARYGGEEFVIVLPETSLVNALQKANQLAEIVRGHEFETIKSLTISLGVSSFKADMSEKEILGKADQALYKAKNTGRDKVVTLMEI